jgi:tryptophanyl-tRNA synthetase
MTNKKGRVFSGARPTGRQHVGNYMGAIRNYVALQDDYECVYSIVDLHALTTLETTMNLRQNTFEMALDWLAAGIRPEETILFVQSHILEVTELSTILSMVTPLGKLTDLPTFKEKVAMQPHNVNLGLVGYPVLMTADILLYKAGWVPVGSDQVPHLEFAREIVRSFNHRFKASVLIEPQWKPTDTPKILGTDGQNKMSKSLDNEIELAAGDVETAKKIMTMVTDPQRMRRTDPGNPDVCNVFAFHKMFSPQEDIQMVNQECRVAGIGCVDCKKLMAKNLNAYFAPFRARRVEFASRPDDVWDILKDGAGRARLLAQKTMQEVHAAIGLA